MKLLFKREQVARKTGRALFNLWGKIELDELESAAVRKYKFDSAILIEVEQPTLIRNSAIVSFLAFVAAYLVLAMIGLTSVFVAIVLGGAGANELAATRAMPIATPACGINATPFHFWWSGGMPVAYAVEVFWERWRQ